MRVLCAPDSFKGSLSAQAAAAAMAEGLRRLKPVLEIELCPIADGGEGSVAAILGARPGTLHELDVQDPLGRPVRAGFGILAPVSGRGVALVEMAAASGLTLLRRAERNPLACSSYGTGQLMRAALDLGVERVMLFLGGSATHDGGCGAAQALGVEFFAADGAALAHPIRGRDLPRIERIDASRCHARLRETEVLVCCDVRNPLCGPSGAAAVFGPQKGAPPELIQTLDQHLAQVAARWREDLSSDVAELPGAGAAGGMGGGAVAMLGGEFRPGIEVILDLCELDERLQQADLCLTGEGRLDTQSLAGKACQGVAARCQRAGVPCRGFFGSIADDAPAAAEIGLEAASSVSAGLDEAEAMRRAPELLADAVAAALQEDLRAHQRANRGRR